MTQQELERIRELNAQGYTDREIAEVLYYTVGAVFRNRKRMGVKANPVIAKKRLDYDTMDDLILRGLTVKQIAKRLGCSTTSVYYRGILLKKKGDENEID